MKDDRTAIVPKTGQITPAQRAARQINAAKGAQGRRDAVAARRAEAAAQVTEAGVPPLGVSEARLMDAKATLAELDVAERRGELIAVDQARADVIDKFSIVRTRILGVPSRIAQRLPAIADQVVPLLDELLREALEELADGDAE